jgi:cyclophilin family peptidyl-prolyl cis-trans isomerase
MNPTRFLVASLAVVLIPVACMGEAKQGDPPAKAATKEVKPAKAAAKADGKGDAKADGKGDAKAGANGDAKADAKAGDAPPKDAAEGRSFSKGQAPPIGMTPEEVRAYAEAQGDPRKGVFTLEDALAGDESLAQGKPGKLTAIFDTTMGKFECELFEDKAPGTVANFVGLARGVRESYDKKSDAWAGKKFYDGVLFHRVIKGFMIQTGDPTGSGSGGPGFVIVDELDKSLRHDKPGLLSMANRGKNTGSSQFFVTTVPTPHLDGKHAIFGKCEPKVPVAISEVKVDARANHRPYEPVTIKTIEIVRK